MYYKKYNIFKAMSNHNKNKILSELSDKNDENNEIRYSAEQT